MAALLHAWDTSTDLTVTTSEDAGSCTKTYTVKGPFFFASDRAFKNYFTTSADPQNVIIDCTGAILHDYSAIAALNSLGERYTAQDKNCLVKIKEETSVNLVNMVGRRLKNVNVEIVGDNEIEMTAVGEESTLLVAGGEQRV